MKTLINFQHSVLFFLILCSNSLIGQNLLPSENRPLKEHLLEVNQEWQHFEEDLPILQKNIQFENEQQRIQLHLKLVHHILQNKEVTELDFEQKENRNKSLKDLNNYWQAAVFPQNNRFNSRTPFFKDDQNRSCAVAYLLEQDQQEILVDEINQKSNYQYIETLAYLLYLAGDFSAIDGVAANSIIAWDGDDWQTLGNGVDGEITAIETTYNGDVYIAGTFTLNDDPTYTNIAMWDGESWIGLQQGEMYGTINVMKLEGGQLYIGGDFEMVNGQELPYLAKRIIYNDDEWNNHLSQYNFETMDYDITPNVFSVNGTVNAIEIVEDRLLIGGDFTQTAPNVDSEEIEQLEVQNLAFWYSNNWQIAPSVEYGRVEKLAYLDGRLFVATDDLEHLFGIYTINFWSWKTSALLDEDNSTEIANGFIAYNDNVYAYGNINVPPIFVGDFTSGFMRIYNGNNSGQDGTNFDKTVRACEVFQDNIYFAGDFTWAGSPNNTFDGLVYSPYEGVTGIHEIGENNQLNISSNNKQLQVQYTNLEKEMQLNLYNANGQLMDTFILERGAASVNEDISNYIDGVYFYEAINEGTRLSGKLAVF